jgi:uncharacterized membrane protein YgcG
LQKWKLLFILQLKIRKIIKNIMNKYIITILLAIISITTGCDRHHHRVVRRIHHTQPVHPLVNGSYAYYNSTDNYWYYIWLNVNNNSYTIDHYSRDTRSPQELNIAADQTRPMLEKEIEENISPNIDGTGTSNVELFSTTVMEHDNVVSTSEEIIAISTWENEGGSVITEDVTVDTDTGAVISDNSGMDSVGHDSTGADSGSSNDSGGSDSSGGDSGGGDGGGGSD